MHMADALLSPAVGLAFHAGSAGLLAGAARRAVRAPGYERRLPLMGVLGAFVFAAQMVNFALPGTGSSGHLGGGLLLALLLGPDAAFLVITSVLTVQALFFADGGLLALGCNAFNLGFWPAFVGLPLQRRLARAWPGRAGFTVGVVAAAVLSLLLGALGVALQTALSGRAELPLRELAMVLLGIHLPIGLVEGIVTVGVVRFVERLAPGPARGRRRPGAARGARAGRAGGPRPLHRHRVRLARLQPAGRPGVGARARAGGGRPGGSRDRAGRAPPPRPGRAGGAARLRAPRR